MTVPAPTILLQFAGGASSEALGVSGDRHTIVGQAQFGSGGLNHAVRWLFLGVNYGTPQDLGTLPGGTTSVATAISLDGTTIVGASDAADTIEHGFVWTLVGGMKQLPRGTAVIGTADSAVVGCSENGSIIVGTSTFNNAPFGNIQRAVVWTGSDGSVITELDAPAGLLSETLGCSGDGSIILGSYLGLDSINHAGRWNASGGGYGIFTPLGLFSGNEVAPAAISSDGVVILGTGTDGVNSFVVRSTDGGGTWTSIGFPIGGTTANAITISPDGTMVSGTWGPTFTNNILLWRVVSGFEDVGGDDGTMQGFSSDNTIAVGIDSDVPGAAACWWHLAVAPATSILSMDDVIVTSLATESPCTAAQFVTVPTIGPSLGLRWSDTRGQTFGNAVAQQFSTDPLSNYQWNRTGYARDRVFELFWSAAFKTALNGAFVDVRTMKS